MHVCVCVWVPIASVRNENLPRVSLGPWTLPRPHWVFLLMSVWTTGSPRLPRLIGVSAQTRPALYCSVYGSFHLPRGSSKLNWARFSFPFFFSSPACISRCPLIWRLCSLVLSEVKSYSGNGEIDFHLCYWTAGSGVCAVVPCSRLWLYLSDKEKHKVLIAHLRVARTHARSPVIFTWLPRWMPSCSPRFGSKRRRRHVLDSVLFTYFILLVCQRWSV